MVARVVHRHATADRVYQGATHGRLSDLGDGSIALFGAEATAALAIRDASWTNRDKASASGQCIDLGNLKDATARLPAIVRDIARRGARLIMLGGNGEDAGAFVKGFAGATDGIQPAPILLSPRLDIALPDDFTSDVHPLGIGMQRLISKRSLLAWQAAGGTVLPASAVATSHVDAALHELAGQPRHVVLLVDLSVVDTGYAAGATLRNVGGLTPMTVLHIVDKIASRFDVRGLALLNLAPERDPRGHSERIAAQIAQTVIAYATARCAA